jgi:hypothetical protein
MCENIYPVGWAVIVMDDELEKAAEENADPITPIITGSGAKTLHTQIASLASFAEGYYLRWLMRLRCLIFGLFFCSFRYTVPYSSLLLAVTHVELLRKLRETNCCY